MPFVSLALGLVGACAVVTVSALMALRDLFRPLRYCGRNSIVIYLAFFLPMAATRALLLKTGVIADIGTMSVIITAAGVLGSLALFWAVRGHLRQNSCSSGRRCSGSRPSRRPSWRCSRRNKPTGPHRRIDNARLTAHIRAMPATAKSKSATKTKAAAPAPANPAARPLKKGDHLFLVDGSGYIFRAYHALPPLTRKSDGLQVNAVLGFCNMLWKLLRRHEARRSRPIWRWCSTSRRRPSAPKSIPTTRRTGRTRRRISFRSSRWSARRCMPSTSLAWSRPATRPTT